MPVPNGVKLRRFWNEFKGKASSEGNSRSSHTFASSFSTPGTALRSSRSGHFRLCQVHVDGCERHAFEQQCGYGQEATPPVDNFVVVVNALD
jgi:hypothetical protein